jgi:hypothetical protein
MKPAFFWRILICVTMWCGVAPSAAQGDYRRLPVETYREKMKAAWLGQMIGVSLGAPTEFRYLNRIVPESEVPEVYPGLINDAFDQDDLYVEMTFLHSLETYGLDVSSAQAGIDFANSEYQLWHANLTARENLRQGIAPPDSGHPRFSGFSDDIDYQIESDFAGLISPGMPNNAIQLGETFGQIMNYGDGLYGGQFIACMYAEAFFEGDPQKLVEAGLACIPAQSQYAEAIRDTLRWWQENPDDWEQTWRLIGKKYQDNPDYRRYSSGDDYITDSAFNIDAKINGAYVVLGLLYGERDPMQTIIMALRSGQDSDCNPASAAGVLFAALSDAPQDMIAGLDEQEQFSFTDYNFSRLLEVTEKLARESVLRAGGSIEMDSDGNEGFVIPVQQPQPSPFVQSWEPGPIANTVFTEAQMTQIRFPVEGLVRDVQRFAPGWRVEQCSDDPLLGLKERLLGRENILLTLPVDKDVPCRLTTVVTLSPDSPKMLRLVVGHYPQGNWTLTVTANGDELVQQVINEQSAVDGWLQLDVDLSAYAGQETHLELSNAFEQSPWMGGYWASIELVDKT